MQSRFDASVAMVEQESNKMARVSSRASPLMEMLGGFAVALALIYAGHQVIVMNASAGGVRLLHDGVPSGL